MSHLSTVFVPPELFENILALLSFRDLIFATQVNGAWNHFICSSKKLRKNLLFEDAHLGNFAIIPLRHRNTNSWTLPPAPPNLNPPDPRHFVYFSLHDFVVVLVKEDDIAGIQLFLGKKDGSKKWLKLNGGMTIEYPSNEYLPFYRFRINWNGNGGRAIRSAEFTTMDIIWPFFANCNLTHQDALFKLLIQPVQNKSRSVTSG